MRLKNITQDFICHVKGGIPKNNVVQETGRQASKEKGERIGRRESKRIVI